MLLPSLDIYEIENLFDFGDEKQKDNFIQIYY